MAKKSQIEINRDLCLLFPCFLEKLERAIAKARKDGYMVHIFEGYRSPERQDFLFSQGRSAPGRIVTRAKAWRSYHQYGLAVDLAFKGAKGWTWEGAFDKLVPIFNNEGLQWGGAGDAGHWQLTGGLTVSECERITSENGLLDLWKKIQKGI